MNRGGHTRVSGARSRWIGAEAGLSDFLSNSRHGPEPATTSMPSTMPARMASVRVKKPFTNFAQVKLLPSAASLASSGAGCQNAWSSAGFLPNFFIACTTFHRPTVSA